MTPESPHLLDRSLKLLTRRAASALCRLAALAVDPAQIRFEDTAVNVPEHRADTVLLLGAEDDPDRWGWHLEYQLEPDPRVIPGWLYKNAVFNAGLGLPVVLTVVYLARGEVQASRRRLLAQLRERFGELPASVGAHIEQASPAECETLALRLLQVRSLAELGL